MALSAVTGRGTAGAQQAELTQSWAAPRCLVGKAGVQGGRCSFVLCVISKCVVSSSEGLPLEERGRGETGATWTGPAGFVRKAGGQGKGARLRNAAVPCLLCKFVNLVCTFLLEGVDFLHS